MGKLIKATAVAFLLVGYARINRIMGYVEGTLDTIEATQPQTYERDFGGVKVKFTKTGSKEA